jgi:hypothetical protein
MMNTKTKSAIIIISTLLIGMILGSLITGSFMKNRAFDRIAELRNERGFVKRIERIIRPDAAQQARVREILAQHFEKMHRLGEEIRVTFKTMNDSLIKDLEPILRPEQIERFKKRMDRMRRFGPPPGKPHRRPFREGERRENN